MDIGILESGIHTIKVCGNREDDGTLTLSDGTNVADWPETVTLVSGTVMTLTNEPHPTDMVINPEIAFYEV